MTPEYAAVVASWLVKARSDLATARLLIIGAEPHLDTGSYHCQQAAEKALKGWLTSRRLEFRKTHDLGELLKQCITVEPVFRSLEDRAQLLSPFATQFRYPGELMEPSKEEAIEALQSAAEIVRRVEQLLG